MARVRNKRPDGNLYVGPENGWKELGVNIVRQAIIDWREATLALSNVSTMSKKMLEQKNSAEHFLSSPLCEFYSGLDGKTLLRKLKDGDF